MMQKIVFLAGLLLAQNCLGDVYIAISADFNFQQEKAVYEIKSHLQDTVKNVNVKMMDVSQLANHGNADDVIIAPGAGVLSALIEVNGPWSIIGIFISPSSFEKTVEGVRSKRNITAIYSTPSPARQLALIKALFGVYASVGVLSTSSMDDRQIREEAETLGIPIKLLSVKSMRGFSQLLQRRQKEFTSILLWKDKALFQVLPLDRLILMAYEIKKLGVIGYSRGVVNNGGLATTYSSVKDTAKSIEDIVSKSNQLPSPGYPKFFSIAVNRYVMRSLGMPDKSSDVIKNEINIILSRRESRDV